MPVTMNAAFYDHVRPALMGGRMPQAYVDGCNALAAAFQDRPGIVVTAGTGSMALARDPSGRLHRAGGYGWQ